MEQQPSRLFYPALTGLRFVAASMVFILHYHQGISLHVPSWFSRLLGEFHAGVAVFFVLSGFLITCQYQHYNFSRIRNFLSYILIRVARLFPLYLLVLLEVHSRWLFSVPDLFLHVTLLKGYFKKVQLAGVVQAWTLTVEFTFYLLAPLIFWLTRNKTLLLPFILTIATGLSLTGIGFGLTRYGYNAYGFMPDMAFTTWNTFFGRATEFFAGIWLAQLVRSRSGSLNITKTLPGFITYGSLILFFGLLFLISTCGEEGQAGITTGFGLVLHNLFLPVSILLLLLGLIYEKTWLSKILSGSLTILLGNASYAFYLLHLGRVGNMVGNCTPNNLVLQFLLLWTISVLVHLFYEKPIYRMVKNRVPRIINL